MAKTTFATGNALTKKVWEEKLFRDMVKESYFAKFMGDSADKMVQVKTQLEKGQGDRITVGLRMRLAGAGVVSGQTLEGNEEALSTYSHNITLEQYRHAVRDNGGMDRQRAVFQIDDEAEQAIKDWGTEKIDSLCFAALVGTAASPAGTKFFYKTSAGVLSTATSGTAKTALTAADGKLTPAMISAMKSWALTGGNRSYIPLRPVKVDGRSYLVLLVHPDNMYDLKNDSTFTQALREAEVRGPTNPLFQHASAIWDGVVIHEHENVPVATDGGGASVAWSSCALIGAQALAFAWGKRPKVVDETFDYGNEHAYAIDMICAASKPQFNSKDYGAVNVFLARTNLAGL